MIRPMFVPLALAALTLAGCGQQGGLFAADRGPATPAGMAPSAAVASPADTSVQVAQEFARGLNARVGSDTGGVRILSAEANGPAVTADIAVPTPAGEMLEEERSEIGPIFADALRSGLCAEETARAFFALGNSLTIRFQGSDAVPLTTVTLTSCDG
ncbi:hypothetical protein [Histidinibacterium lentulum]|nr:hypothetical protein [Histidinibacterium lentulum]